MTTAVLFVVFLLVVAGLVAAAGDRMGHLAARRKIRFGKMRPRNVSTLIAVVTGLTISLVTFLILFSLWENFRDALLRHGEVRANLATAQHQLAQAGTDLKMAQDQTQQAVNEKAIAEQELADLQTEASDLRGQVTEAAMELAQKNELVAQRGREIDKLNARKTELEQEIADAERNISGYESVEEDLREVVNLTRAELDAYKHERIVLARGTRLFYLQVAAAENGQLGARLTAALVRLSDQLSREGLKLDPASSDEMTRFVENYPYRQADHGAVVVISADNNVIENGNVLLAFKALPLVTLVDAGEEVLTVLVEERTATVSWLGDNVATLAVPEQFDDDSLAVFVEQLWAVFMDQATQLGFLPDIETGEIANPIDRLASVYSDLTTRERPFIIQIVSASAANALSGLADCKIYVSKWPPDN
jgi:uncharacterized protein (DUF3084 family)